MQKPKVSVITPVYNTADYLVKCLDSLEAQTLQEIEFICVNDGSTDNSLSILEDYAQHDERFHIITQDNGGYGKAMNHGLQEARGEYIGIVESDDYVKPNMFEELYTLATQNNADICKTNYYSFRTGEAPKISNNIPAKFLDTTICPCEDENIEILLLTPSIWSAIYNRDFLLANNIWFNETPSASYQDTGFVHKASLAAKRMHLASGAYVYYRLDRDESSSNAANKVFAVCNEYESVLRWLKETGTNNAKIIAQLETCKLNTYLWNLRRLQPSLREAFMWRCHREFAQDIAEGKVDRALFAEGRLWHLDKIVDKPEEYLKYMRENYAQDAPGMSTSSATIDELAVQYGIAEKQRTVQVKTISGLEQKAAEANTERSETIQKHEELLAANAEQKAELEELKTTVQKLEERSQAYAQEKETLQEQVSTLNAQLSESKALATKQQAKIKRIKTSWSYRIGHALLAPLRALKRLLRS